MYKNFTVNIIVDGEMLSPYNWEQSILSTHL